MDCSNCNWNSPDACKACKAEDVTRITIVTNRESIVKQTIQNLVEAGILLPHEVDQFTSLLESCSMESLLAALITSHQRKEDSPNTTAYYPISSISLN